MKIVKKILSFALLCHIMTIGPEHAVCQDKGGEAKETTKFTSPEQSEPRGLLARAFGINAARGSRSKFEKKGAIVYREFATEKLKCDVYIPKGDGPFPGVLAVHGGAWRSGSKFVMLRHAWMMAEAGYVVVAINYRHAPEHRFPAQIHDCKYAVRWMRANAKEYKIDPERIGGFGYSAGGHLVALLGTTDEADELEGEIPDGWAKFSSRLKAVAAGGAPCEFSWIGKNSRALSYWMGGTRSQKPEAYELASPVTHVTQDDPPFYLFHGDGDIVVPKSSAKRFHQALIQHDVKSKFDLAEENGHLGTFSDLGWMEKAIEFFDTNLKN